MTIFPLTDEGELCPLFCGQLRHEEPGPAQYGMTCPGFNANVDMANAFTQELGWRKEVAAAYGETLASSKDYTEALARRRKEATERVLDGQKWSIEHPDEPEKNPLRAEITHADLVAHVNEVTPQVVAKVQANADLPVEEFEPVGKPLRVPTKDLSRRGPKLALPGSTDFHAPTKTDYDPSPITAAERKEAAQVPDYMLFIDNEDR